MAITLPKGTPWRPASVAEPEQKMCSTIAVELRQFGAPLHDLRYVINRQLWRPRDNRDAGDGRGGVPPDAAASHASSACAACS
ncbi:hypothetical protein [Dyella sp.]|uniref:hypothetical protein n=1 Tax=Dyella sp. TaxID=1869338 RepID=UPI002B4A8B9F|nr:hypothetical protein [Dyella sp.]HKT30634.1 hypothetical protein [Dyella sp.]